MNKHKAEKAVKRKLSKLKPCPFCGSIPKATAHVDSGHSMHGSIGHYYNRQGCCKATGMGQTELFFCNDNRPADYGLWKRMVDGAVHDWNMRIGK